MPAWRWPIQARGLGVGLAVLALVGLRARRSRRPSSRTASGTWSRSARPRSTSRPRSAPPCASSRRAPARRASPAATGSPATTRLAGQDLKFGPLAATKMSCDQAKTEDRYLAALGGSRTGRSSPTRSRCRRTTRGRCCSSASSRRREGPSDGSRTGGKTVLITGGSKGIGLACAHSFAAEGANVRLAARTPRGARAGRARDRREVRRRGRGARRGPARAGLGRAARGRGRRARRAGQQRGRHAGRRARRDRRGEVAPRLGAQGVRLHQPDPRGARGHGVARTRRDRERDRHGRRLAPGRLHHRRRGQRGARGVHQGRGQGLDPGAACAWSG